MTTTLSLWAGTGPRNCQDRRGGFERGGLVGTLFDDEITLLTYPVVLGKGTRLFPDTGQDTALELLDSRSTPSGVIIQVYRPS
jgi:hypothetical protein